MKPGRVSQTKVYVYNVSQKTVCHTKQMQIISINQGRLYLCSKTTLELMKDTNYFFIMNMCVRLSIMSRPTTLMMSSPCESVISQKSNTHF